MGYHVLIQLAAVDAAESTGGIDALGLNWQSFLFQMITFIIVLLILRQFVFKRLIKVLDDRRTTVEKSLEHAAQIESQLQQTEKTVAAMLADARTQADHIAATSRKDAAAFIQQAEENAAKRAERIMQDARAGMEVEASKLRKSLKAEAASLVALATERIIKQKLDTDKDSELIRAALQEPTNGTS